MPTLGLYEVQAKLYKIYQKVSSCLKLVHGIN